MIVHFKTDRNAISYYPVDELSRMQLTREIYLATLILSHDQFSHSSSPLFLNVIHTDP